MTDELRDKIKRLPEGGSDPNEFLSAEEKKEFSAWLNGSTPPPLPVEPAMQLAGAPRKIPIPAIGGLFGYWSAEHNTALTALMALGYGNSFWNIGRTKIITLLSTLPPAPSPELVNQVLAWIRPPHPFQGAVVPAIIAGAILSSRQTRS
jgi:hypothetical protein